MRTQGLSQAFIQPLGFRGRSYESLARSLGRQWQRNITVPTQPNASRSFRPRRFQSGQRHASTVATDVRSAGTRLKNLLYGSGLILVLSFGFLYITDTRASVHQWLVIPAMRLLHRDAEDAHHAGVKYLKILYALGLHPRERTSDDERLGNLKVEVFGHVLNNPVGVSAGLDKDVDIADALLALGPGLVEVGGVTPFPQEGNPKPRVFRIPSQKALINRYGLNSEGADHIAVRLRERVRQYALENGFDSSEESEAYIIDGNAGVPPGSLHPGHLLAVQIAKNKTTPDSDINAVARDYVYCVERLAKFADILVVNVSSPNTPGLRDLQAAAPLTAILTAVVESARSTKRKSPPAVMVKVSPDEDSDAQIDGICTAVWASGVDGVIVGNTTKKRPDPIPKGFVLPEKDEKALTEVGGYSGPQMFGRTLDLIRRYRKKLDQGQFEEKPSTSPSSASSDLTHDPADAKLQHDLQQLPSASDSGSKQPLIQLPERHTRKAQSAPSPDQGAQRGVSETKVIFATGGITNGRQCLEVLNAGASLCQIYTAMMYGGVGTITRIKAEMKDEIKTGRSRDGGSS